VKISSRIVS